jgi:hypothetical protein
VRLILGRVGRQRKKEKRGGGKKTFGPEFAVFYP